VSREKEREKEVSEKMRALVIMGETAAAGTTTEITLSNIPPLASIVAGKLYDRSAGSVSDLTVVSDTPDENGEIQLTATNKFKIYLTNGLAEDDILILQVEVVGEKVAVE